MRKSGYFSCLMVVLLLGAFAARAQEKPAEATKTVVPLKIQVVFNEYEGEKKIGSLPYFLHHAAEQGPQGRTRSSLRMGIRVPILTMGKDSQVQYHDVGTNLDCMIEILPGGVFRLNLQWGRSSVYQPDAETKQGDWKLGDPRLGGTPFIRNFSGIVDLLLRDGQTAQATMATDPASGRVMKVDITLNVVK